ncbi:hypothetical protein ABK040_013204 [Willaertia magna]
MVSSNNKNDIELKQHSEPSIISSTTHESTSTNTNNNKRRNNTITTNTSSNTNNETIKPSENHKPKKVIFHEDEEEEEHANNGLKKELSKQQKQVRMKAILYGVLLAILSFFIVAPVSVVIIYLFEMRKRETLTEKVKQVAITAELSIQRQLEVSFGSLITLTEIAKSWNYSISQFGNFNKFGAQMKRYFPEIQAFEYIPYVYNKNISDWMFRLDYVYPYSSKIVGSKIGTDPNHVIQMQKAISENRTTVFGPAASLQGGQSLIAQHPIFYENGTFFAFSCELIAFMDLANAINLFTVLQDYAYQLYEYPGNRIFLQDLNGTGYYENVIKKNVTRLSDALERDMTILNTKWRIILKPLTGWFDSSFLWLEILIAVLVIVIVFILIIFVVVNFVQDHYRKKEYQFIQERLELKVKERTRDLANSHSQLLFLLDRISLEEKRMKKIVNSIDDCILTINLNDFKIIHCNASFYKIFGFNEMDIYHYGNVTIATLLPNLQPYLEKKEPIELSKEIKGYTKTGMEIPVKISINFTEMFISKDNLDFQTMMDIKNVEHLQKISKQEQVCIVVVHPQITMGHLNNGILSTTLNLNNNNNNSDKERLEFQEMFDNHQSRKEFKEFCAKEHNDENICFLEDVLFYKSLENIQERLNMQKEMFDNYIKNDAPKQLNISKIELETFSIKISKGLGDVDIFDDLQGIVIRNVIFDVFKRFKEYLADKQELTTFI